MQERTADWDIRGEAEPKPDRPSLGQTFLKVIVVFFVGYLA